jgi:hypothetical protein
MCRRQPLTPNQLVYCTSLCTPAARLVLLQRSNSRMGCYASNTVRYLSLMWGLQVLLRSSKAWLLLLPLAGLAVQVEHHNAGLPASGLLAGDCMHGSLLCLARARLGLCRCVLAASPHRVLLHLSSRRCSARCAMQPANCCVWWYKCSSTSCHDAVHC